MTLPISDPAPASGRRTTVRPNGQRQNSAIRADAIPNGMVMIRTNMISADDRVAEGHHKPAEDQPDQVQQEPH